MSSPTAPGPVEVVVEVHPMGSRVQVAAGTTLLSALAASGLQVASVCGGSGSCGTCKVFVRSGGVTPPRGREHEALGAAQIESGARLACQAVVLAGTSVEVPPSTISTLQRLQFEDRLPAGREPFDPPVVAVEVEVAPPHLADLRSDATRLRSALAGTGLPAFDLSLPVMASAPAVLRAQDWHVQAIIQPEPSGASSAGRYVSALIAVLPRAAPLVGLAVDVGTTKLAAYLVDLSSGEVLAKGAAPNPQIAMGEDVMTRVTYACSHENGPGELHRVLLEGINDLARRLLREIPAQPEHIVHAVVVGNTAMHHSFAGLPLQQLGTAPYVPAVTEPLQFRASDVGLELAPGAFVYLPPNIAGFVGADHTAALLVSGAAQGTRTLLLIDIGTNTEISLARDGHLWTCSCASGPAFEGAHIRDGMRAAGGAIERVAFLDGEFRAQTIGDLPPVGICGSGVVDAVAAGIRTGIIKQSGGFLPDHPLLARTSWGPACVLVPAAGTGHGQDILLTRADVSEIQLAKAAIAAGAEILLAAEGIGADQIDEVLIAGAFGTYLNLESAVAIGMLPHLPATRYRQLGNAAGHGARRMLTSRQSRHEAESISRRARYVELTSCPDFAGTFAAQLNFPPPPGALLG